MSKKRNLGRNSEGGLLVAKDSHTHHDDLGLLLHSVRDQVHHVHCVALAGHPQRTEPGNPPVGGDMSKKAATMMITSRQDNESGFAKGVHKFEGVRGHRPGRTVMCCCRSVPARGA